MRNTNKIIAIGIKAALLLSLMVMNIPVAHASEVTGTLNSSAGSGSQVEGNIRGASNGTSGTISGTVNGGGGSGGSTISGTVNPRGNTVFGSVTPALPNTGTSGLNGSVIAVTPGLPNTGFGPDSKTTSPVVLALEILGAA